MEVEFEGCHEVDSQNSLVRQCKSEQIMYGWFEN